MTESRRAPAEDIIHSSAELPRTTTGFRKRVLRAAKQAQRRRDVRRKVQWSLGGGAAAIALAACFHAFTAPEPSSTVDKGRTAPGASATMGTAGEEDWDLVESFKKQRAKRSGAIHGSF